MAETWLRLGQVSCTRAEDSAGHDAFTTESFTPRKGNQNGRLVGSQLTQTHFLCGCSQGKQEKEIQAMLAGGSKSKNNTHRLTCSMGLSQIRSFDITEKHHLAQWLLKTGPVFRSNSE